MQFDILRASNPTEAALWDSVVEGLPPNRRDIHFTSAYGRVQERLGGQALLALMTFEAGVIAQVFIKRPVPSDLDNGTDLYDLCSPYGYGGPMSSIQDQTTSMMASVGFRARLRSWAASNRIVSEFSYLHPLMFELPVSMLVGENLQRVRSVAVILLTDLSEKTVSRRVRRGLKRARDGSYRVVEVSKEPIEHDTFSRLYRQSMDRMKASSHWHFSDKYFDAHYSELGARLFMTSDIVAERPVARILMVIGGYGTAYAHFLGSDGQCRDAGLDELLYFDVAQKLAAEGYMRFHLGGGLSSDDNDPLLAFKRGFGGMTIDLQCCRRIFDADGYAVLAGRKQAAEINEHGRASVSGFFPEYRRGFV